MVPRRDPPQPRPAAGAPGSECSAASCFCRSPGLTRGDLPAPRAPMGLCYSLRPLLFGSSEDTPCAASEPCAEDAQPSAAPAPAPIPAPAPVGTLLRRGGGRNAANARPPGELQSRRRQEQLRAEEREAAKEARKVSRGIDRMLREQKRDLQQTHRLLLLGRCAPVGTGGDSGGTLPWGMSGVNTADRMTFSLTFKWLRRQNALSDFAPFHAL